MALDCAKQSSSDGLPHLWIDTCCIEKSNNIELQEAINSMFRWYEMATRCYVYLTDVSITNSITQSCNPRNRPPRKKRKLIALATSRNIKVTESPRESEFRRSRWFTRGWTLQELLRHAGVLNAPTVLVATGSPRNISSTPFICSRIIGSPLGMGPICKTTPLDRLRLDHKLLVPRPSMTPSPDRAPLARRAWALAAERRRGASMQVTVARLAALTKQQHGDIVPGSVFNLYSLRLENEVTQQG